MSRVIEAQMTLPLYYTGLITTARIREQEGPSKTYRLDRATMWKFR